MKALKQLNKYFRKYKRELILGAFITILARVFSLVMPESVQSIIEKVEKTLNGEESPALMSSLTKDILLIIGTSIISGVFTFWMRQLIINVSRHIEFDLKNDIFRHYETLSQAFYKKNRTGDLMSRISEDVNKVRMYAGPAIMYSIQTLTLFVCVVPLMFYTSPALTLYTLLPLPVLSATVFYVSKSINKRSMAVQEFLSNISAFSQEIFSGIRIIKAYNLTGEVQNQVHVLAEEGKRKSMRLAGFQSWFTPLIFLLIGLSNIFVIFIGGKLYIEGEIQSIGVIIKFSIYTMMLTWPVATVGWVSSIVQQAEASQKRINEFLNTPPEIVNDQPQKTPIAGDIAFKNVSLTYEDTGIQALKNVSFEIRKGETVAFLGKIGSGKSSVLDLIARFYDPTEGVVEIDGKDVKRLNLYSLRRAVGYVPQDAFLFSDTIKNNLLFGNADASDEQITEAAKKAAIHASIAGFKEGYGTVLGERGLTLSGGQKQRVCIARALLKDPKIYLFDDCLSAVDTATEEEILISLKEAAKDKTTIIVSHRISSCKNADRILIFEGGRITQEGSHQELMKTSHYYRNLYETQYQKISADISA